MSNNTLSHCSQDTVQNHQPKLWTLTGPCPVSVPIPGQPTMLSELTDTQGNRESKGVCVGVGGVGVHYVFIALTMDA